MRRRWTVVIAAVLLLCCAACGPSHPDQQHSRVRAYLEHALDVIQQRAYYTDRVDWPSVRADAAKVVRGADSARDTYAEIEHVLAALGDHHSSLMRPAQAKAYNTGPLQQEHHPTGHRIGDLAMLTLPSVSDSPQAVQQYLRAGERAVTAADGPGACGWLLDLRWNGGGDMWAMLAVAAPLLGDGQVGAFLGRDGQRTPWRLHRGTPELGATRMKGLHNPVRLHRPHPPVAVLTGPATASAAEAVTVAFHGRPHTRSFGDDTAGVPTANTVVHLDDGAMMLLMVALDQDRDGHTYHGPIPPDDPITPAASIRTVEAATGWLHQQPACSGPS